MRGGRSIDLDNKYEEEDFVGNFSRYLSYYFSNTYLCYAKWRSNTKSKEIWWIYAKIEEINDKIYTLNGEIEPLIARIDSNNAQIEQIKVEVENTENEIKARLKKI